MGAAGSLNPDLLRIAFIFILVGYGTKVGLAPMHTWLPDAHSQAPTPVSALLSGVLLNCAMYGILRFHMIASGSSLGPGFSGALLLLFGLVSLGVAAAFIIMARDFKRLLAYSSIEHMGIIAIGFGFGGFWGIFGALFHMLNHTLTKTLLFFGAGNILQRLKTKEIGSGPWSDQGPAGDRVPVHRGRAGHHRLSAVLLVPERVHDPGRGG